VTSNYGDHRKSQNQYVLTLAIHDTSLLKYINYNNDIALIMLDQPFVFSGDIGATPLAGQEDKELEVNDECIVAGWGRTESEFSR